MMKKKVLDLGSLFLAALFVLGVFLMPVPANADPKAVLPQFLLGDADVSGSLSAADARKALRFAVGLEYFDDSLPSISPTSLHSLH